MKVRAYVYGVGLDSGGRLIPYLRRASRQGNATNVLEEHTVTATHEEAGHLRDALEKKWAAEMAWRAERGRVALHQDNRGKHLAIILDPAPQTHALFLTTRSWAKHARLVRDEELEILGPRTSWVTYLASVVRPRAEFKLHEKRLPDKMLDALRAEFPRERAS